MDELLERYYSLPEKERKEVLVKFNQILKPAVKKKQKYGTPVTSLDDPSDKALFEMLRRWRNKVATDTDMKPWIVFHNQTLTNLAFYRPTTKEQLVKIHGVGDEKSEKYGEELIGIITAEPVILDIPDVEDMHNTTKRRLRPNK